MNTEQTQAPAATSESTGEAPQQGGIASLLGGDTTNTTDATDATIDTTDNSTLSDNQVDDNDQQGDDEVSPERPEWLPEGFDTPESLLEDYNSMKEKMGDFTGAPEEYSTDSIELPEGFEFYEDGDYTVSEFKNFAKEMGVNQEGFNKIMGYYAKTRLNDAIIDQQNREKSLLSLYGNEEKSKQQLSNIGSKVKGIIGDDGHQMFVKAAAGDVTAVVKLVESLLNKSNNAPTIPTKADTNTGLTEADVEDMMRNPEYQSNENYRNKVAKAWKQVLGEK